MHKKQDLLSFIASINFCNTHHALNHLPCMRSYTGSFSHAQPAFMCFQAAARVYARILWYNFKQNGGWSDVQYSGC
jgi:hypothetical protein